jgi:hypothetical protein
MTDAPMPMPWDNLDITEDAAAAKLARLDATWRALLDAIDGIPEHRLTEPGVCGEWSMSDLLGHIAFWDRYGLERGRDSLEQRPFQSVPWEEMNEQDVAQRRGRAPAENRADMETAHAEMLAFVAVAPRDPDLLLPMLVRMGMDTDDHYEEHAAEIRAWRMREGI